MSRHVGEREEEEWMKKYFECVNRVNECHK